MLGTKLYGSLVVPIIVLLAVGGTGVYGYNKGFAEAELEGAVRLANLKAAKEQQIKELEQAASQVTEKVVVQYVDRVQEVVKNNVVYRDVIKEVLVPSSCNLSNGWIGVHDAAATQTPINQENPNQPSDVTDTEGLSVVVDNYAVCQQTRDQLVALQDWVEENYIEINKDVAQ